MTNSLPLGKIAGIRVQVHWTFFLLIGWVLLTAAIAGSGPSQAIASVALLLVIFGCVILHELGHALAARSYGIPTRDITLLPIGGVARLQYMPRRPIEELVVALAGPAVNLVIASALLAALVPIVGFEGIGALTSPTGGFLSQLLIVNVMLVLFNLLPAFPMDGGRVLRALLAMVTDYRRATRIATVTAKLCAVGFGLLGFVNPFLFLIAAFVFFAAAAEMRQVEMQEELGPHRVADGMVTAFRAVPSNACLRDLADTLFEGPQCEFPVVRDGQVIGMLSRDAFVTGLLHDHVKSVEDVMRQDVHSVEENDPLLTVFEQPVPRDGQTIPVTKAGVLTGLLDLREVIELVKARAKLREETAKHAFRTLRSAGSAAPNLT